MAKVAYRPNRRGFVLAASSLVLGAAATRAFAGGAAVETDPASSLYVSTARGADGRYCVVVVSEAGEVVGRMPLTGRGHDVALSSDGTTAVAFARRPGNFAVAFDATDMRREAVLFTTPEDRHFYGHGVFSADGRLLYATENDFEAGRGVVGVYDVARGFARIGELDTFGAGPHDLLLLADGVTLAIANGGIETHPDAGRADLNVDTMRPSLVFVDSRTGDLLAEHVLAADLHQLSIRHLCRDATGRVWFGGQWQGGLTSSPPLVGFAHRDDGIELLDCAEDIGVALKGYVGSVAASADGRIVAASAPKAGRVVYFDAASGRLLSTTTLADCCGIAPSGRDAIAVSSGHGALNTEGTDGAPRRAAVVEGVSFDNHLRRLRA